jgi:HK97 family phage prohead protease
MSETIRQLPEVLEMDFIITDESVNRYGWRLLVEGINLEPFKQNPVCCVEHFTLTMPIGKWKNLRIEEKKLIGTVEFDKNDPEAVKLYWKYKDGYMNAVSLHVLPLEESDAKQYILPGQKYATLVTSELIEISLVTVPGQKNAVKLSSPEGKEYKLNLITHTKNNPMEKTDKTVEQLQQELQEQKKLNAENLITIHKNRGVITEGELPSLHQLALSNYETVKGMLEARMPAEEKKDSLIEKANALVQFHFDRGAITEGEKPIFQSAAQLNFDQVRKELESRKGKESLTSFVQNLSQEQGTSGDDRSAWTYMDWYKKDLKALNLMEKNEPAKYQKLALDYQQQIMPEGYIS